jgi:prepilin-type N-terminal cleavage/methylation domain-containing protein
VQYCRHGLKWRPENSKGFSAIEILVTVVLLSLITAISVKPLASYLERLRAKSAADGLKHYLIYVRSQAIANPGRHCGVTFKFNPKTSKLNDSVYAFYDVPANNVYDKGTDVLLPQAYALKKQDKVWAEIINPSPTSLVFRGDGSAHTSHLLNVHLNNIQFTIDVLASTGRVKVVAK